VNDLLDRLPPEERARVAIDRMLGECGWVVQHSSRVNLAARQGVAVQEFVLQRPHGRADYLLFVDGKAVGVIEAKKAGATLTGVEWQSAKYTEGLPDAIPAHHRPLPFVYESTGVETRFTNAFDPDPRSRAVFSFHRPETLAAWLRDRYDRPDQPTLRARLRQMPPVADEALWAAQATAIRNLERSLADNRPRSLIQMATGSGKTFTACNVSYRLIKHADARRVLFLVDRSNLGRQTLREFQSFVVPDTQRKFSDEYIVQRLTSNALDTTARVTITTIQRLYSILKGEADLDPELEEHSPYELGPTAPVPVEYNPAVPIEFFDVIVIDECHRSIYGLWRQVLDYFDAFLIGLTATPNKQAFGFFNQNLVMEYPHERAVADGVNVDFDVYRIRTEISQQGATMPAGLVTGFRDRQTRAVRWQETDDDVTYAPQELDRAVVAKDQIRTIVRTFRARLFTEIFPGRTEVPKTLIFAKDDSHADDVVQIVREEFGKGNEFIAKITYKSGSQGQRPEDLLASFRNSYNPRIAVTVDMIATGTDVKPLECVFFMRTVKSRTYFEQMKGRGVRVINPTDLKSVTPDAQVKDRFVIVDAVGVTDTPLCDTAPPLERQPTVPLDKLLRAISLGNRDPDAISSIASRLARLDRQLTRDDRAELFEAAGGIQLPDITRGLVDALDPDRQLEAAQAATGKVDPTHEEVQQAATQLLDAAVQPLATNPELRQKILDVKRSYEQLIDEVSQDTLLEAGHRVDAQDRARQVVQSFRQFIEDHKDEITALQILYSRPYAQRLTFKEVKELAHAISRPPHTWTPERLWQAYETLDKSKVRGSGPRTLTDIVSIVRFALEQEDKLVPFTDQVQERFDGWLLLQDQAGRTFTAEQRAWLNRIRDHVAASMGITVDDFDYTPFAEHGGIGKAYEVFGDRLQPLLEELTGVLAA
jgi:type I restriction enzyme, R subunit